MLCEGIRKNKEHKQPLFVFNNRQKIIAILLISLLFKTLTTALTWLK